MRAHAGRIGLVWATVLGCVLLMASARSASAQTPLEVGGALDGESLDAHVSLLFSRDPSLAIDSVSTLPPARFVRPSQVGSHFGYTRDIVWVRLEVTNEHAAREWLLELAAPMLDDVVLFAPHVDGSYRPHETGDMRPFATRDIAYRTFVFVLHEPANGRQTYFLRLASTSPLGAPLVAWSMKSFIQHQHGDWSALCIFYGLVFIMACFNAGVYGFTRQREYLPYVGFIVSIGFVQFSLAGHTYQFLLPNDPWLAHHLLPAALAATLGFAARFISECTPSDRRFARIARALTGYCSLMLVLSFVLPHAFAMQVLTASMVLMALYVTWHMARRPRSEGRNEVRLFFLGWCGPLLGGSIAALHSFGILPANLLTSWAVQIGVAVQLVLISSGLADRYNAARADLSRAHDALSDKVSALSLALQQAERATREAERATRAKDEFMATMSHEFRTPLNPIINLPEGLLEDFVQTRYAACNHCHSTFELEGDEQVLGVACPECQQTAGLEERTALRYTGDPLAARRFLAKIEQSGHKLLRIVNGILDYAKLESGRLKLVREPTSIAGLLHEVVTELQPAAQTAGIGLVCEAPSIGQPLFTDPYRLHQVLTNLVENAIKFSPRGSTVTLRGSVSNDGLLLSVRDQGIGIAAHDLTRIFESFEQVHKGNTRQYGGVGLGLSVARSLVHMHRGDLWVDSEVGCGSTFYVRIPAQRDGDAIEPEDDRVAPHEQGHA